MSGFSGSGKLGILYPPQGRLTLTSATPVMTTSVAAATTVYYTPACGNQVPIYDGANMVPTTFAELSQATTDATKSPAAVVASSLYDLFAWNDAGTMRCTRGPAWTNATTRSAGTALVMVNGILLNSAAITNGPAASRGTYVGTIASNASSTIDYIFGAAASGGGASVLNVWNAYNRVNVATNVTDTGASYTYSSTTVRQARGSAGNQISFLIGLAEDGVSVSYSTFGRTAAVIGSVVDVSVALDSVTAFNTLPSSRGQTPVATSIFVSPNIAGFIPAASIGIGLHYVASLESSDANVSTFNFTSNNVLGAKLRM